jgi:photosystem II stability/assembly factor-like uncharacterized protein
MVSEIIAKMCPRQEIVNSIHSTPRRSRWLWLRALVVVAALAMSLPAMAPNAGSASPGDDFGWGPIRPWDSFFSVASAGAGKWLVVGKEGVLLTSTDDGRTWTRRQLAKRGDLSWYDLTSIRFAPDGKSGWIAGERGIILHTSDGGETWTAQKSGVDALLFRICPIDSMHAVGVGAAGAVLWTTDGGVTWHSQILKGQMDFFDASFGDSNDGWAVGEFQTVVHTSDGGKTWAVESGGDRAKFRLPALMAVAFADTQHGWAAGQGGVVLATSDGGKTWTAEKSLLDLPLYSAALARGQDSAVPSLWLSGDEGSLMMIPVAGGKAVKVRPTFSALADVAFSAHTGIAVGNDGTLLRSDDGGKTWKLVELP